MPIVSTFPGGSGSGGGGGLALASVTNITTQVASEKVYVKWTDPDDLEVSGAVLATWAGTLLVRKAGSMPTSRRDGTVVLDSKTRNAYQNTYFCDSGLTNGTTYYYKFFPYSTASTYTDDTADEFTATPVAVAPGNVSGKATAAAGNGKLSIKWTDPDATVTNDGVTLATWASTKVVVKAGSYATDPDDASAAYTFNSTTRNAYATTGLVATGLTNGTTYYVSLFPISTDGGVNTNSANRITGVANRMTIAAVPAQSGTLTYNGDDQSPSWDSSYDTTKMTLGGTTVGKNAGTYTATFTLKDDYMWAADSTTGAKNAQWAIGQASGTLTVSKTSITLDKSTTSTTFTIGGNHDGTLSVTSSDTSVAKATLSGTTVTVSSVNNTTGSATITVSCAAGTNYTAPSDKAVSVTAKFVTIYGVQWDGTSSMSMTRTDASASFTDPVPALNKTGGSSPFDNLMPWSGMTRVTDSAAGELVAIPKFWYKLTQSGSTIKIQIADGEVDGFSVSPAHMNRGDGKGEHDTVYIGRYHCATSTYKSTTGVKPAASVTRANARTAIHNLGSTIWQMDFAMRFTIWLLYAVEFAHWNSQDKIGYGCGNNSATENMGYTDGMYHTGSTLAARTTYGVSTQYRYIEGLWDNVYDWMDGCYYNSSGMNIILNPSNFSDSSGGTLMGKPANGWIAGLTVTSAGGFPAFYNSSTSGGGNAAYIPDNWSYYASDPCLRVGGYYHQSLDRGLFCVDCNSASSTNASIGCRLMKLP